MKASIIFSECEHDGDLGNYIDDLKESGAMVKYSKVNESEEEGIVVVEVENGKAFLEKFKQTESYEFSNLAR